MKTSQGCHCVTAEIVAFAKSVLRVACPDARPSFVPASGFWHEDTDRREDQLERIITEAERNVMFDMGASR